jgi:hypothetical protein
MQTKEQARLRILELCAESEYGSLTFWSEDSKTEAELASIFAAIVDLVKEGKLEVLQHKLNGPYDKAAFHAQRLRHELEQSMIPAVDPDTFYWFAATEEGKNEYEAWAKEYWTEERVAKEKERWRKWKQNEG